MLAASGAYDERTAQQVRVLLQDRRAKLKGWAKEKGAGAAFRGYELRNERTLDLLLENWGHSSTK